MSAVHGFYDVLGVSLPTRAGSELSVRCFGNPTAHNNGDRTPSTSVNVDSGVWFCHVCGVGGGSYDAAIALGQSPAGAMSLLERFALLDERGMDNGPVHVAAERQANSLAVSEADVRRWHENLLGDSALLAELEERRGWTHEAISLLGVGFDGERVTIPARDAGGNLVALERYAPFPERRTGPKLIADAGSRRELIFAPGSLQKGSRHAGYVFLTEGIGDALAALSVGLEAVSVPGVNGWRSESAPRFTGRRVAVLFDCDKPGRDAARRVAADLVGVAAEVRVVDLDPDRDDGFDLSDLLHDHRALDNPDSARRYVLGLVEATPKFIPPPREDTPSVVTAGKDVGPLLDDLIAYLRRYVVASPTQMLAVALWTLHTHALDAAEATPYLSITSAEKESGKTQLLEVLEHVVSKPWLTGRVSAAALVRKVDQVRPTLLLDESDAAFKGDEGYAEALRGILNTGYRQGGTASLCIGQGTKIEVRDFSTFGPKAIAGLGQLPDTIASRSIRIELRRNRPDEGVERCRRREVQAVAEPLRAGLESWAGAHLDALAAARPAIPDELGGRAADVWEPLLAVADAVGGQWPERARAAALALSARSQREDDSLGVRLLADIRRVFESSGADRLASSDLVPALTDFEDAPWADLRKPLTANQLARRLKPFGIRPKGIRVGDETPRGYEMGQFEDAWSRYLPVSGDSNCNNRNIGSTMRVSGDFATATEPSVLRLKKRDFWLNQADVADVAVATGGNGETGDLDALFGGRES